MTVNHQHYRTVWYDEGAVLMIDQLLLPFRFAIFTSKSWQETCQAINTMVVRGAGAIGAAAGYAMAQAAQAAPSTHYRAYVEAAARAIKDTRPTAYNLFYAVDQVLEASANGPEEALKKASQLANENEHDGWKIGQAGLPLIRPAMKILTHCNAGWLAFVDWGTALSPIYQAAKQGLKPFVWVGETRPRSQGARLTAWELHNESIDHCVIADNAVATLMAGGKIDMVITGADRIAENGDTANKTGTLDRAILAAYYKIPFYIAAPFSTFDPLCLSGKDISIETRDPEEVLYQEGPDQNGSIRKIRVVNPGSTALNPAFDVTPAALITGIITEKGIIEPGVMKSFSTTWA